MHWFIDPIKNQYADFTGRSTRQEYWMFVLVYVGVAIVVGVIAAALKMEILTALFSLATIIPSIAIATRRLHDIGKSGWWQLISLVPIIGPIVLIVWLATKSTEDNEYGPRQATVVQTVAPGMDTTESGAGKSASMVSESTSEPGDEIGPETTPDAPEAGVEENTQKGFGA